MFVFFRGTKNVVGVDLCLRNNDAIAFVMPYIHHDRFQDYFDQMKPLDLQAYMNNLLVALHHVHSFGVIHRDVKPSNFLHDRKNQKYLLVDFGLAQTLDQEQISTNHKLQASNLLIKKSCDKEHNEQEFVSQPNIDEALKNATIDSIQSAQTASEIKRKASNDIDDINPPKRNRSLANSLIAPSINAANANENAKKNSEIISQQPQNEQQQQQQQQTPQELAQQVQYIPSQFKAPLKQQNEISTPKNSKIGNANDSPFTRHIKSAVLSYSLNTKLQEKRKLNNNDNNSTPQPPNATNQIQRNPNPKQIIPNHKYNCDNRRTQSSGGGPKCYCYGRPTVCNICLIKREIHAPRAGTPGYRPSEVLLKYPNQTTAVDVWAAGVILISILSGCYPFFKGNDDITALAEIITVFGDEIVKKTANALGRHVCISRKKRPLHLRKLCIRLRNRCKIQNTLNDEHTNSTNVNKNCENCEQIYSQCLCQHTDYNNDFSTDIYPDCVYDLLANLLAINPKNRITADEALQHQFFKEIY